ncbi:hypothetical protein [Rhodopseudomonas sp. B29]|uniref:Pepco domain-containing protein n=1 Tax=Rhodopseudomonas sp. B29 TaxID=95607 RepID=UPI0011D2C4AF|nr:hypothetical protein [Rhodopseudomonas sp. B29]
MASEQTIPLLSVTSVGSADNDLRGRRETTQVVDRIPVDKLQEQLARFTKVVNSPELFASTTDAYELEEIKIALEVSASGELGFVVANGKASAKGSIELKFRRRKAI